MPDETTAPADPGPSPATPELDKMHKAREDGSETIGAFLEWLGEQGLTLCKYQNGGERWVPSSPGIQPLLARYYGVDLVKIERERRAILAWHVAKSAYLADREVKARPRTQGPAPTVESWPAS